MSGHKVGLAILGLGRRGGSRLKNILAANPGRVEVRWVVERDENVAKALVSQAGLDANQTNIIKPWLWDTVCKDKNVDAVVVCAPTATVNVVRRALQQGKAVMCDRPISLQTAAILACYQTARDASKPLLFAFPRRFDPILSMLREKVQSGAIGQVHSVRSSSCYPSPDQDEVIKGADGIFRNCVAHEIDTISWLLGQTPQSVFATGFSLGIHGNQLTSGKDHVSMTLRFCSGTIATIDIRQDQHGNGHHLEMTGSQGILIVDPGHPEGTAVHCVTKSGTFIDVVKRDPSASHMDQEFAAATTHFLDVVQDQSVSSVTVLDTLRAAGIAATCRESQKSTEAVAQATERPVRRPEVLLQEQLWKECAKDIDGNNDIFVRQHLLVYGNN